MRDIEILVQGQLEALEAEGKDDPLLRDIQKILYSTEVCIAFLTVCFDFCLHDTQEGFEVPEGGAVDEEETF